MKIIYIINIFLLKFLLEIIFNLRIREYLSYDFNFTYNSVKIIESYFILFLMSLFIDFKNKNKNLSNILTFVLFTVHFIPFSVVYGQMDFSREFMYMTCLYWIILLLGLKVVNIKKLKYYGEIKNTKMLNLIFIIWSVTVPIICLTYFNININWNLLDLFSKEIYEVRENNSEIYDSLGIINIFMRWGSFVVFPLMFIYFYSKGKKLIALIPVVLQLLLFFTMPFKSWILVLPLAFVLYLIYNPDKFIRNIILLINSFLFFTIFCYKFIPSLGEYFIILLVRRIFIVPPMLSNLYYEFFSERTPYYIQASFLKYLMPNEYSISPPYLISLHFYGREFSANTGLVGDAYALFKFWGIILLPIIYVLLFKLMDYFTNGVQQKAVIGVVLAQVLILTNSSIIAILFGHGFLFMLFFLSLIPKNNNLKPS